MKLGNDAYLKGSDPAPDRCILAVYYSATPESAKTRVTNSFTFSGNARVAIASTSLSMEIDFPHVRYVIHFEPGRTLTDHLQQAGRAGRDSQNAYNIVMYMGKHPRQCEVAVRDVVKKSVCIRKLLLCHFTDDDLTLNQCTTAVTDATTIANVMGQEKHFTHLTNCIPLLRKSRKHEKLMRTIRTVFVMHLRK